MTPLVITCSQKTVKEFAESTAQVLPACVHPGSIGRMNTRTPPMVTPSGLISEPRPLSPLFW